MNPPCVMFVTYGAGHVDIVAQLLPAISAQGLPTPVVLALTTAPSRLPDSGHILRRCADYLPMEGYEHALTMGAALAREMWSEGSGVSWEETCAYLGISMCDLEARQGRDAARKLYAEQGRKAFCPVDFMERVLQRERPDIVVTTCHVRMERAATIAARHLGIRCVLIEDLLGYSLLGPYPFGAPGHLIAREEWPDMAVVMNDAVKDILVRNGFPDRRIAPLGQPALSQWRQDYASAAPLDLFREGDRPVIAYIAPPQDDLLDPQTRVLLALMKRRRDLDLIIKLHPSTAKADYLDRHGRLPENVRVLAAEPVLDVVKTADAAILFRSTVGLLCAMTATPMICWDATGEPELMPYVASGAAELAEGDEMVECLIDKLLAKDRAPGRASMPPLFDVSVGASGRIAAWLAAGAPECPEMPR